MHIDDKYNMVEIAGDMLYKSKCKRRHFAAVLCDRDGQIIGTGYNKTPDDKACKVCVRQDAAVGSAYTSCPAGHAEMYAILDALAEGMDIDNSMMFVAGLDVEEVKEIVAYKPCFNCALVLALHNIHVYGLDSRANLCKWDMRTIYSGVEYIEGGLDL